MAGVSPGSTTHYFSSRRDLIREAFRWFLRQTEEQFHAVDAMVAEVEGEPVQRTERVLCELVGWEFTRYQRVRAEYELLLFASSDPVLAGDVRVWELRSIITLGAVLESAGAARPIEAARTLANLLRGYELERLLNPRLTVEDFRRRLRLVLAALCPLPAAAAVPSIGDPDRDRVSGTRGRTAMSTFPYTEESFWHPEPSQRCAPLGGVERCDVAIVGGGYTGLAAALRLRERGIDVAVVEAEFCGAGASGRNTGHLTPTIGKDMATVIRLFGRKCGARLFTFAEHAVDSVEAMIDRHAIECEYDPTGNIMAGVHPKHEAALRKCAAVGEELGLETESLDGTDMRAPGLPPAFEFGLLERRGGTLDPWLYVSGLRSAALASGVRIYEDCAVSETVEGDRIGLRTRDGSISAEQVLLATNGYTVPRLNRLHYTVAPVRVNR